MHPFVFRSPTRVIFGNSSLKRLGQEAGRLGKKALLVSGRKALEELEILDEARELLHRADVEIVEHRGVSPEPTVEEARRGVALAKAERVDMVIAMGGGSVLDVGKAISAGTLVAHDLHLFFTGKKPLLGSLPLLTVPSLAGSGSETNSGMVLTLREKNLKLGTASRNLFPATAILDPSLTTTAPLFSTMCGVADAACHILEVVTTRKSATTLHDRLLAALLATILENGITLRQDPGDIHARSQLLWATNLAGNGLATAGCGWFGYPMHVVAHGLGSHLSIPHGAAVSVAMRGWLELLELENSPRLAWLHKWLPREGSAEKMTSAIIGWLKTLGLPVSLEELDVSEDTLDASVAAAMAQAKTWRLREITPEQIRKILWLARRIPRGHS